MNNKAILMIFIMLVSPVGPAFAVSENLPEPDPNYVQADEGPSILDKAIDRALIALYLRDPPLESLGPEYAESLREISEFGGNVERTTPMLENVLNESIESLGHNATEIAAAELEFAENVLDSMLARLYEADLKLKASGDNVTEKLKKARKKELAEEHEDFIANATAANAELSGKLKDISASVKNAKAALAVNDTATALQELSAAKESLGNLQSMTTETKTEREIKELDDLPTRPSEGNMTKPRRYFPKEEAHADIYTTLPEEEKPLIGRIIDELNFVSDVFAQEAPTPPPYEVAEEIKNLSIQLDNNPAKIYAYVRDEVEYTPYYGYMKGSLWTMWEGAGNDFDQAALTSDLLRAAGYETRFVIGTVEVEPTYMKQVLGVNTTEEALQLLWENYVPAEIENRKILVEHVWVEAYIPYHDYRGFVMDEESRSGWQWVPIDAAFVPYVADEAYPVPDIDYDITSVFEQTLEDGTYGEDYFTGLNFSGLDFATEELMNLTDEWYAENVGSVLESMTEEEVEALYADKPPEVEATIIPGTTPYAPLVFEMYTEIPEEFLHIINIRVVEGATEILSFNIPSIETVGRQLTLDYVPANEDVAELVNAQASLTDLPAYLLDFRPILMLNSVIIAVGNASTFGTGQELQITIATPNQQDIVSSPLQVGNYYALAFDLGDMPADNVERVLNNTLEGLAEDNTMVLDHSIGGYMSLSLLNYFAMVDMQSQMLAESMGLRWWRNSPAVAVFGTTFETEYTGSVPSSITTGPSHIDVVRNVLSIQADKSEKTFFTLMSGAISSSWESIMFDLFYSAPGTSTVDVMRLAMEQGVPVYHITTSNIDKVDQLNIPSNSKQAIRDSVNQGLDVYVPGATLTHVNWTGIGWLVIDSSTGANAWMIGDDLGSVIHGGSSIHVSFASESHEFSEVDGHIMRTTNIGSATPKAQNVSNSLTNLSNGMTTQEAVKDTKSDSEKQAGGAKVLTSMVALGPPLVASGLVIELVWGGVIGGPLGAGIVLLLWLPAATDYVINKKLEDDAE